MNRANFYMRKAMKEKKTVFILKDRNDVIGLQTNIRRRIRRAKKETVIALQSHIDIIGSFICTQTIHTSLGSGLSSFRILHHTHTHILYIVRSAPCRLVSAYGLVAAGALYHNKNSLYSRIVSHFLSALDKHIYYTNEGVSKQKYYIRRFESLVFE